MQFGVGVFLASFWRLENFLKTEDLDFWGPRPQISLGGKFSSSNLVNFSIQLRCLFSVFLASFRRFWAVFGWFYGLHMLQRNIWIELHFSKQNEGSIITLWLLGQCIQKFSFFGVFWTFFGVFCRKATSTDWLPRVFVIYTCKLTKKSWSP